MRHAWLDHIPGRRHLHPLGWDRASGPETRARVLLTLGPLEQVVGFVDMVMRDRIDNRARPDLVEGVFTDRPAPDHAADTGSGEGGMEGGERRGNPLSPNVKKRLKNLKEEEK